MNRSGFRGTTFVLSRRNIEAAEVSETCCSRTIWISVEKSGFLAQSGGVP
jgi:hypothetical protein